MQVTENDERRAPARRPALLYGVAAIASYWGAGVKTTRHLIAKGVIPTFKVGAIVCARPEAIDRALDELERQQAG